MGTKLLVKILNLMHISISREKCTGLRLFKFELIIVKLRSLIKFKREFITGLTPLWISPIPSLLYSVCLLCVCTLYLSYASVNFLVHNHQATYVLDFIKYLSFYENFTDKLLRSRQEYTIYFTILNFVFLFFF